MARDIRNFMAVVLTAAVVGLGIALIGVTQDAPGEGEPGRWHIVDRRDVSRSTARILREFPAESLCGWSQVRVIYVDGATYWSGWGHYVRDPNATLEGVPGLAPFQPLVALPDDVISTGWANSKGRLLLALDGSYAYIARGGVAEAWPRSSTVMADLHCNWVGPEGGTKAK